MADRGPDPDLVSHIVQLDDWNIAVSYSNLINFTNLKLSTFKDAIFWVETPCWKLFLNMDFIEMYLRTAGL